MELYRLTGTLSTYSIFICNLIMSMPGSFPEPFRHRQRMSSALNSDSTLREVDFVAKKELTSKTDSQKSLIVALNTTTYFLIGYQFLRYTHSACLPPSIVHVLIQFALQPWRATIASDRDLFAEQLDIQEQMFALQARPFNRLDAARVLLKQTCLLVYYSFLASFTYHILFYIFWVRPVALSGKLEGLEHGSWFGLSFIGESINISILSSDMLLIQLWKLELGQVLLLDLAILLLQLTIYQCIFLQSTLSPIGIRLSEPEAFILPGEPGVPAKRLVFPSLIQIKLYETFSKDSFVRNANN